MKTERGRRNGISYSTASSSSSSYTISTHSSSVPLDGVAWKTGGEEVAAVEKTPLSNGKSGNIVHHVSKMDTLAGIAIKYGVEVYVSVEPLTFVFSPSSSRSCLI